MSHLPNKDLDLMMRLYADDAVLTDTAHDNKVYQGNGQVRSYWANVSGPFRPQASLDWLHAGNANQK
jgi:ketosteroid isomerase-like protein